METLKIGIIILGIVATIVKSMDMFLRIALEHISEVITVDGWVILHALVVWRLVISIEIVQQGKRHQVVNSIKVKRRLMLRNSKCRWTKHGRKMNITSHQLQMRSLHPMDQVITSPPTRQSKGMWDWYLNDIFYISYKNLSF